jgi:hypothetical protein
MANIFSRLSNQALRALFYSLWAVLSLVQAWGTELFDDEAYYWVYSRFLDWGYFDHPPVIAVLIKMGTFLFAGEFGVRFFIVIIGIIAIYLIEYLTKPKDLKLFYAIILNIAILQIGGIIAVPDIALLFFTVMFFITYQHYQEKSGILQAVCLSLIIALLLYSKYHGILIILATLLSNMRLLKRPMTWLVVVLSMLLFLPHVLWQMNHGFPSIVYQLHGWVSPVYKISFTTDYLLGQLLIAGPLLGWLFIWSALRKKPVDMLEKAMLWSIIGVYAVFLISSFGKRTEANWTIPLIAPLILLSYRYLITDEKKARWVYLVLPYSLVLICIVRLYMFLDIPPFKFMPKDEFHGNKQWVSEVKQKADGRSVVFTNSYQRPSKYWFSSGDTSFTLNAYGYRQNNYNLWPLEASLQGKKVMAVGSMNPDLAQDSVKLPRLKLAITYIDSFDSHSQVMIEQEDDLLHYADGELSARLLFKAVDSTELIRAIAQQPELILIVYQKGKKEAVVIPTGLQVTEEAAKGLSIKVKLPKMTEQKYFIRWGLSNSLQAPTINSRIYTMVN